MIPDRHGRAALLLFAPARLAGRRHTPSPAVVCLALGLAALPLAVHGQEWTRFRGPNGTGHATGGEEIPTRWTADDYDWSVDLPGEGHSQPVLWGARLFVTCARDAGQKRAVLCLDAQGGSSLWSREYPFETHPKHLRSSYASSTPTVDADRVYVLFADPKTILLLALTHEGQQAWRRDLGTFVSQHGNGASPVIVGDLVVVPGEGDEKSFVAAVDRKTGEVRWRIERDSDVVAYGTPCLRAGAGGRPELVFTSKAHGVWSLDPETGKVAWQLPGVFDKRTVSSPLLAGDLVLGTCGSGGGGNYLVAVRPPAASAAGGPGAGVAGGDAAKAHKEPELAYKLTKSIPYVPTSIVKDGVAYLWGDKGILSGVVAATGEVLWQRRVDAAFSGSPVLIGDRMFCMSEGGEVIVARASREFEELARNPLGEGSHSTPAVAGGRLYLRTFTKLRAIGGRKEP